MTPLESWLIVLALAALVIGFVFGLKVLAELAAAVDEIERYTDDPNTADPFESVSR